MRRLLLALVPVLGVGIVATELAMDLNAAARTQTYTIYAVAAALTVAAYLVSVRLTSRVRHLALAVQWTGTATVAVAAVAVVMAARSMFFNTHDRDVLLVVLAMGVALAAALAWAFGSTVGEDLRRMCLAAERVAEGDLTARTGVARRDEVGQTAAAFDAMVERLEATESERSILIASVGHDLRTPLAAMRAAIEAMEDGLAPDPAAYLRGMGTDVEHLSRLVEDLFAYARIESGRYEPVLETMDLRELADETVEVCAPIADGRGVELVVEASGGGHLRMDAAGMGRVLRNLVDNAIRHSSPGGRVTVEVSDTGYRVLDQGPGFEPGFRSRAFEHFTVADPARSGGGGGLGLAIARGIVEAHGGVIEIEDGPGGRVRVGL
ncbi:MAG: ATP-binding protein [Acidimicrobiia bacterium]